MFKRSPRDTEDARLLQFWTPSSYKKFLQILATENETTMANILNTYIKWMIETGNPPIGFDKTVPEPLRPKPKDR
jgi:hypothetical protein